jgi:serine phosphatase RsbU (regulator of sigma subunit)
MAISVLEQNPSLNVISLVRYCHEKLRPLRGAVMSLASFNADDGVLSWIGVGNVEGILLRSGETRRETLLLRGGVVGAQLPPLQAAILPVSKGDTLIFATDGIHDGFTKELPRSASPAELAKWILTRHAKAADEALALVATYTGRV